MAYEDFFGLKDTPFRLTPDPEYYFPSDVHKEALQTLLFSIRAGEGFVQITGAPGTGKTLILRTILRQLGDEVTTALILNPSLSPPELLRVILEDLGLDPFQTEKKSKEALLRYFRDMLLEKAQRGVKTVVIIDEAQNLPNDTMEELRLLSNLETEKEKLLQIILVGQIELEKKLQSPDLKQLNQRITIRYRLKPLSKNDTIAYIYHRIRVAGGGDHIRFSPKVLDRIHSLSKGVPRLINIICERALMAAFVEGKNMIAVPQVKKAMESIAGEEEIQPVWTLRRLGYIMVLALIVIIAAATGWYRYSPFLTEKPSNPLALSESEREALVEKEMMISKQQLALSEKEETLSQKESILIEKESDISQKQSILRKKEENLREDKIVLGKKEEGLTQKEEILRKKEDALAQKEELLAKKQAVTVARDSSTTPVEPHSLANAFYVPKDNFLLSSTTAQTRLPSGRVPIRSHSSRRSSNTNGP